MTQRTIYECQHGKAWEEDGQLFRTYTVDDDAIFWSLVRAYAALQSRLAELEGENQRLRETLAEIRKQLETIVCTEGCDAGVVLLSHEGPTHFDPDVNMQVYDHEYFSPLGDALIALHGLTTEAD